MFLVGLKNSSEPFGLYLMVLAFFHASEFVVTGLSNPRNLSWDSFLVNHSVAYWAAMLASWLEHGAWLWWGGAGAGAGAGRGTPHFMLNTFNFPPNCPSLSLHLHLPSCWVCSPGC